MYEKQTWVTGEVITKEKLNHMEDGIADSGGGSFLVSVDAETGALNKTWKEIHDAFASGKYVPVISVDGETTYSGMVVETSVLTPIGSSNTRYNIVIYFPTKNTNLCDAYTNSENGYPIMENDEQDVPGDDV